MPEKLEGTGLTPRGRKYLDYLRGDRTKSKGRGYSPTSAPRRRDEIQMVSEQDTPDGQRERTTRYHNDEAPVVETIGPATGARPVAVPGGEHTELREALDMIEANAAEPGQREGPPPEINRNFRDQMERRAASGGNRRVFGIPARPWKDE